MIAVLPARPQAIRLDPATTAVIVVDMQNAYATEGGYVDSAGFDISGARGVIDKIVQAVDPRPGDRLVEIGPGQGAITLPLLRRHGALTVIEFDRDLVGPLAAMAEGVGELTIVHRDVLYASA